MDDLEDLKLRGRQAAELLEHPLLVAAFAALEDEVMNEWKQAPARDVEGREKLWLMLKMGQRVRFFLESHITSGKLAAQDLDRLQKRNPLRELVDMF